MLDMKLVLIWVLILLTKYYYIQILGQKERRKETNKETKKQRNKQRKKEIRFSLEILPLRIE